MPSDSLLTERKNLVKYRTTCHSYFFGYDGNLIKSYEKGCLCFMHHEYLWNDWFVPVIRYIKSNEKLLQHAQFSITFPLLSFTIKAEHIYWIRCHANTFYEQGHVLYDISMCTYRHSQSARKVITYHLPLLSNRTQSYMFFFVFFFPLYKDIVIQI